jgi:acyl dehydratase
MAGKYYEELEVGQHFAHQPGRTITEADNVFFTTMTMNPQPLHLDFHAAAKAEFGKPLVNSLLTLGIAVGLSVGETTLGTTGNLGFERVEFPSPSFTAIPSTRRQPWSTGASRSRGRSGAS